MGKSVKQKYLWERKTDTSLQFWPKDSKEYSLIKPTVPQKYIGKGKGAKITSPKALVFDALGAKGIRHSAITEHVAGFYTQRAKENFNFVSFTTGGCATLKINGKTLKLTKGTLFYASTKSEYILSVSKKWNMVFFHISPKATICKKAYIVAESKNGDEIAFLANKYLEEINSAMPSYAHLESIAELIDYCIKDEFVRIEKNPQSLANTILNLPKPALINKTAKQLAKDLNVNLPNLNAEFQKLYNTTCAGYIANLKLAKARTLLAENKQTISDIAKKCGFATSHSFDKAFLREMQITPTEYIKRTSQKS